MLFERDRTTKYLVGLPLFLVGLVAAFWVAATDWSEPPWQEVAMASVVASMGTMGGLLFLGWFPGVVKRLGWIAGAACIAFGVFVMWQHAYVARVTVDRWNPISSLPEAVGVGISIIGTGILLLLLWRWSRKP